MPLFWNLTNLLTRLLKIQNDLNILFCSINGLYKMVLNFIKHSKLSISLAARFWKEIRLLKCLDSEKKTRNGLNCSPYSFDLCTCDFFLRKHLKNNVYLTNRITLCKLKLVTECTVIEFSPNILKKTIRSFESRFQTRAEIILKFFCIVQFY